MLHYLYLYLCVNVCCFFECISHCLCEFSGSLQFLYCHIFIPFVNKDTFYLLFSSVYPLYLLILFLPVALVKASSTIFNRNVKHRYSWFLIRVEMLCGFQSSFAFFSTNKNMMLVVVLLNDAFIVLRQLTFLS